MTGLRAIAIPVALASIALSPAARAEATKAGCIDANAQVQSLRREGRFAEARVQLRACLDPECPRIIRNDCAQRLDEIDRAQPTIVFELKGADGRDLAGATVAVDHEVLTGHADGTAIAVDPGPHTFVFEAPGQSAITQVFVINEGEKGRRERIVIGLPAPATPAASDAAGEHAPPRTVVRRTIAAAVGAIGVATIGAGAVFGIAAAIDKHNYEQQCGGAIGAPPSFCNPQGIRGHDDAAREATFATAFLVGGGVALAAGLVLAFTDGRGHAGAAMGLGPSGMFLRGGF